MQRRYSTRYDSGTCQWLVVDTFLSSKVLSRHAVEMAATAEAKDRHESGNNISMRWNKFRGYRTSRREPSASEAISPTTDPAKGRNAVPDFDPAQVSTRSVVWNDTDRSVHYGEEYAGILKINQKTPASTASSKAPTRSIACSSPVV